MKNKTHRQSKSHVEAKSFSSVREFMQRTTPQAAAEALDEVAIAPAIMCHVFLLSCVLERTSNREAERHGLTIPQWMALGCIGNEGKTGITHSELCHRLMLSKAPVTGLVDRLERDGYVKRAIDEKDRRVTRIVIKAKGEAAWHLVRDALREHAQGHCSGLDENEQQVLVGLLARLLEAVSKSDPMLPEAHVK